MAEKPFGSLSRDLGDEAGMARQPRAWQRMLSGRRLDLLDPTPVDIEIEDIAHGLAFVARWNGQTLGDWPYSVAEHSLLVEEIFARLEPDAPRRWRLAALLHDAPEYVIGDMISPVKAAVGSRLRRARRAPVRRHPHPVRPARRPAAESQEGDQAGRPRVGLARGHADRRLLEGRGRPLLRRGRARRSLRAALGQDALERAAVHVQPPRGFGHVAVALLVDALDVLPPHPVGRHRVLGRRRQRVAGAPEARP
jgi:hypothetical protein